ncbi:MAG: hypothetical protein QM711_09360, partial [Micropruina sp.]|uniref:hypothetical protein n=1 Tax=Micropruina sp. TaxID=2737536 RepID=UPI0039E5D1B1
RASLPVLDPVRPAAARPVVTAARVALLATAVVRSAAGLPIGPAVRTAAPPVSRCTAPTAARRPAGPPSGPGS